MDRPTDVRTDRPTDRLTDRKTLLQGCVDTFKKKCIFCCSLHCHYFEINNLSSQKCLCSLKGIDELQVMYIINDVYIDIFENFKQLNCRSLQEIKWAYHFSSKQIILLIISSQSMRIVRITELVYGVSLWRQATVDKMPKLPQFYLLQSLRIILFYLRGMLEGPVCSLSCDIPCKIQSVLSRIYIGIQM